MAGALGVVITTDVQVEGRAAVPVYVDDSLPIVGPSRAIQVVTSGPMAGGPALAVRMAPAGTPAIGPALPVYVVPGGGSLGAASAPTLPTANLVAEYRFDEASGQLLRNRVNASAPAVANLLQAPEGVFGIGVPIWDTTALTFTETFAADPLGGNNATRVVCTAGNRYTFQSVVLAAGAHTLSLWVKSNTGSAQAIRMTLQSTSADIAVPTTWTRISYTVTVTAGAKSIILVQTDVALEALDILIYGALLETGSSPSTYQAQVLNHTLGSSGAADSADPTWNAAYLTFAASKFTLGITSAQPSTALISAYALVRWNGAAGWAPIIGEEYNANKFMFALDYSGGATPAPLFQFGASLLNPRLAYLNDNAWHVIAATYDGTTMRYYVDSVEVGSVAATIASVTLRRFYHGKASNVYFSGDTAYTLVYSASHSAAEIRSTTQALRTIGAARGLTVAALDIPKFVVCEGDSITATQPSYPYLTLRAAAPPTWQGRLFATASATLATLNGRTANVDALYTASRSKNILSVLIGRNDLDTLSAATFVANLKTYCLARRAAGWTILLCTITPSTFAGFNTKRNDANTLIYGDTSFYDGLADFAADATMGPDAAASDTLLYSDGTHPTATGQGHLKTVWEAALTALLA